MPVYREVSIIPIPATCTEEVLTAPYFFPLDYLISPQNSD